MRQVWRIALALLDDAFEGAPPLEAFPLFATIPKRRIELVTEMTRRRIQSPQAHGVGRYFDAFGSLFLGRAVSAYEGQVALEWNMAADAGEESSYPYQMASDGDLLTLDLRPTLRAAFSDYCHDRGVGKIAARFHNAVAGATATLVRSALERTGPLPVLLTGGCFQNALLTERVLAALGGDVRVYRHGEIPPGDGGLALGQACIAASIASRAQGGL